MVSRVENKQWVDGRAVSFLHSSIMYSIEVPIIKSKGNLISRSSDSE